MRERKAVRRLLAYVSALTRANRADALRFASVAAERGFTGDADRRDTHYVCSLVNAGWFVCSNGESMPAADAALRLDGETCTPHVVIHHIVVIDDALSTLRQISTIAAHIPDVVVHPFASAAEAMFWSKRNTVDAFVLAYGIESPGCIELTRSLRAEEPFALVPLIIVSEKTERDIRLAAFAAGANDFIERPVEPQEFISRLRALLSLHDARAQESLRVGLLESWLQQDEERLRRQADRLASLWRIANNVNLTERELTQEVLEQSTAALRSGQFFTSSLSHLDGDAFVVDARSHDPDLYQDAPIVKAGTRRQLDDTIREILQRGSTHSWDDILADPIASRAAQMRPTGSRALIVTPFAVGHDTYLLSYWSREPVTEPFGPDDETYVELVAMFFAFRLQQSRKSLFGAGRDACDGKEPNHGTQFRHDARTGYRAGRGGAVALVDIARFRDVKERYGRLIGDALLSEVGSALERRAGESANVGTLAARVAGDNFGVFVPGITSREAALDAIAPFTTVVQGPFSTGPRGATVNVPLAARYGVAWSENPNAEVDDLIAQAGTALHEAKHHAAGHIEVFAPGLETATGERMRLIGEISAGLTHNEFELYYQPHVDLTTQRITGAEALIRWHHPTRGTLLPDTFIPFAERNGMISAISSWVIERAIAVAPSFGAILPGFRLYLNLSALDLGDLAVVTIFQRAADAGAHLEHLGVEITEAAAMQDVGATIQIATLLRGLGIAIAIDAFGTGYGSFGLLRRLPVDIVKIGHAVVSALLMSADDAAVTETVIGISRRVGSVTLGEGVETNEQRTWLHEHGCDSAQGYLIAKPLPIADFLTWLSERTA
jgi:diguanylate cyclase (GGDEF)-like protein